MVKVGYVLVVLRDRRHDGRLLQHGVLGSTVGDTGGEETLGTSSLQSHLALLLGCHGRIPGGLEGTCSTPDLGGPGVDRGLPLPAAAAV